MQTAKRILLVDDDKDDQEMFCEALAEIYPSINCAIANNGLEALQIAQEPPPYELIFLDLNMPKMDGFECLRRFREIKSYQQVPIIIVSTSDDHNQKLRCKSLGASDYFTKSTSFEPLIRKLRTVLSTGFPN